MTDITVQGRDPWQWLPPLVGMATAAVAISIVGGETVRFGDAQLYTAAADALLHGQGYPRETSVPVFVPPYIRFCWLSYGRSSLTAILQ